MKRTFSFVQHKLEDIGDTDGKGSSGNGVSIREKEDFSGPR